jgi:hypothetical protein
MCEHTVTMVLVALQITQDFLAFLKKLLKTRDLISSNQVDDHKE